MVTHFPQADEWFFWLVIVFIVQVTQNVSDDVTVRFLFSCLKFYLKGHLKVHLKKVHLISPSRYSFLKKNQFIYSFLAALGFRCCTRAFSSCGEPGLLFIAVRGLLTSVASLVAEHGL